MGKCIERCWKARGIRNSLVTIVRKVWIVVGWETGELFSDFTATRKRNWLWKRFRLLGMTSAFFFGLITQRSVSLRPSLLESRLREEMNWLLRCWRSVSRRMAITNPSRRSFRLSRRQLVSFFVHLVSTSSTRSTNSDRSIRRTRYHSFRSFVCRFNVWKYELESEKRKELD